MSASRFEYELLLVAAPVQGVQTPASSLELLMDRMRELGRAGYRVASTTSLDGGLAFLMERETFDLGFLSENSDQRA